MRIDSVPVIAAIQATIECVQDAMDLIPECYADRRAALEQKLTELSDVLNDAIQQA